MAMSIGVDYDYTAQNWKTCLMENGQTLELYSFADSSAILAYIDRTCAMYAEPTIALSSDLDATWAALQPMTDQQLNQAPRSPKNGQRNDFLIAVKSRSLSTCCLPGIKQLPSVAAHRKLNRLEMGAADKLCTVALLLYRLCERETVWSEMNFLYLEVQTDSMSIIVVEDGQIVNGVSGRAGISEVRLDLRVDGSLYYSYGSDDHESTYRSNWLDMSHSCEGEISNGPARAHAFWEGLTQELAGLMAIHHCEDIVVVGRHKDTIIEWFDDMYQLYHFPYEASDQEGFEAAIGAAIIAEGLGYPGLAAEVVERMQICSAISSGVDAPVLPETQVPSLQLPR